MQVALIQFDIVWEDPRANLSTIREMLPKEVDLAILPEMFLTGFTMEPKQVAEAMESENVTTLQNLADETGVAIMGSLVIEENSKLFNRLILFSPGASMQYYDKRHLFTYGGEGQNYSAGKNSGIFQLKDWKICARICYDLRFPTWCRNTMDYDLIVFVASWPKARHHAWTNLIQARAIENQAFAIGVNRIGQDGNNLEYLGGSMAVNYNGDIIADVEGKSEVRIVQLDKTAMENYRAKLPFLKDQDRFTIDG